MANKVLKDMSNEEQKKQVAKAYEKYAKGFTPRPTYLKNTIKAFFIGGLLCTIAMYYQNYLESELVMDKESAGSFVTITFIVVAQLLTGIGIFDSIAKFAGAGVIVPITGFANSMVSPAMEYKKEGIVLGVGSKLFSVAGPVLVTGIASATIVGLIYWLLI